MRIVVATVAAVSLAAAYQPAVAQAPGGDQSSSLMPMPRVAQYSVPATGLPQPQSYQQPAYQQPTAAPKYQHYQPAIPTYQPRGYGQTGSSWTHPQYQPGPTRPQAHYNYANYTGPPQPQVQPTPRPTAPAPAPAAQNNPYLDAMSAPWESRAGAAAAPCQPGYGSGYAAGPAYGGEPAYGAGYGPVYGGGCGVPCCPKLCGSVSGLYMIRDGENPEWFSFDTWDESYQLMKSTDTGMDWTGGFEVSVARPFCCCRYAVQGVYWGLFPSNQESSLTDFDVWNDLATVYDFSPLVVDDGWGGTRNVNDDYYDWARRHRLRRSFEYHNVEINFLAGPYLGYGVGAARSGGLFGGGGCHGASMYGGKCGYGDCGKSPWGVVCNDCCGPRLAVGWLAGLRYFQVSEGLQFATDQANHDFDYDDDEMYYDIDVDNHLIGFQLGFNADYAVTRWLHLRSAAKFGVYGNHINHKSLIHNSLDTAYVEFGPNAGMDFDVSSNENEVAFLGELDLALAVYFTPRLIGTVGYRIVGVSGIAVPVDQIPRNFAGIQDVQDIDTNGSFRLHGLHAGVEYSF
jgi:hypothetical protein